MHTLFQNVAKMAYCLLANSRNVSEHISHIVGGFVLKKRRGLSVRLIDCRI